MRATRFGASPGDAMTQPSQIETAALGAPIRPPRRRARALLASGVGLVAAFALTGCQWTSTIQTDVTYEPADGTTVQVGGLQLANVLVISQGQGAPGNVSALAINHTGSPIQLSVETSNGVAATGPDITVPPYGSVPLTNSDGAGLTIPSVPEPAGSHITLNITSSAGNTAVGAPILPPEGYYAAYGPTGTSTATASPTATATGASPTETPASPTGTPQPGGQSPAPTATGTP